MVGNSRLHWAEFVGECLTKTWHSQHGDFPEIQPESLIFASVVPEQTALIRQRFPAAQEITLGDIPLKNLYPTLGIDRALGVWGAGQIYGFPCLVIDGGTALTFSGVDGDRRFVGGAILAGLRLQFQILAQGTAALPEVVLPETLPNRWAMDTHPAITSGILHTVLAGIKDFIQAWQRDYPQAAIVLTGGDGQWLSQHLPEIIYEPDLIFLALQTKK